MRRKNALTLKKTRRQVPMTLNVNLINFLSADTQARRKLCTQTEPLTATTGKRWDEGIKTLVSLNNLLWV
ncbi:MAG: hypothetical protein Q7W45_18275 [Bacteroidota bacterium]|nr:hypothetical protein [Bacteroidota bacterium]